MYNGAYNVSDKPCEQTSSRRKRRSRDASTIADLFVEEFGLLTRFGHVALDSRARAAGGAHHAQNFHFSERRARNEHAADYCRAGRAA